MTAPLKRVFVVGCPRSGTTWAMYLLAEHPAVVGAQQVGLFHAIEPLEAWWHNNRGWGRRVITGANAATGEAPINHRKLPDTLGSDNYYDMARRIADIVYDKIAAVQPGTQVVADQTAENLGFHELILRMYPDAYFLHIVRDPRAVFASWRKALKSWAKENGFTGSAVHLARRWCEYDAMGVELAQQTDRYKHVRYEDLLSGGAAGVLELFEWLGLEADAELAQRCYDECAIDKMRQKVDAPQGFIRKGSAEAWRDEVAAADVRVIEYIAQEAMDRIGYERITPRVRKPLRLRTYDGVTNVVSSVKEAISPELRRRLKSILLKAP